MLARSPCRSQLRNNGGPVLMPFLFCTRTILRTHAAGADSHFVPFDQRPPGQDQDTAPVRPRTLDTLSVAGSGQASREKYHARRRKDDSSRGQQRARNRNTPQATSQRVRAITFDGARINPARERAYFLRDRRAQPREESRRKTEDIPFERFPSSKDPYGELTLEGSTITPNERKAFEGLFQLNRTNRAQETGQDAETPKEDALDAILNKAKSDIDADGRRTSQLPDALRPLVERARGDNAAEEEEKKSPVPKRNPVIPAAAKKEIYRVSQAMQAAQTDVEIWQILEDRVLKRVIALGPANSDSFYPTAFSPTFTDPSVANALPLTTLTDTDLGLLPYTLPEHLTNTIEHLQAFPSSHLALNILPHIKALGRIPFALGASTKLYNMHMRLLFTRHTDLGGVVATLEEMEREVYAFDRTTNDLLHTIILANKRVKNEDAGGSAVKALWLMKGSITKVKNWKMRVSWLLRQREIKEASDVEFAGLQGAGEGAG